MCAGEILEEEMKNVFNLGIGYCVVVPSESVELTLSIPKEYGLKAWNIGYIE